ncbi:unnamed protein product [Vitrella brassicaformis CCMP3155]|uniref:RING-type E3 ubiquitin transferase n=2 Tax=Vitrella brassicaformis TaxID=1169539 RepID=A0A0G4EK28_VITBC|nr:unnamed protein product [Vitrella brassicaformis CCMP3155]|eukprot:CEL96755.1 unnamed protein product [Vitrella brassicaformis CCMP3155]
MPYTKNFVGVAVEEGGRRVVVTVNDETTAADVLNKVNSKIATNPAFQANRTQRLVVEHLLVNGDTFDADINIREACEDGDEFVAVPAFVPPPAPPPAAAAASAAPLPRGQKRPHETDRADQGDDNSHQEAGHKAKQLKAAPAAAAAAGGGGGAAAAGDAGEGVGVGEGKGPEIVKMETDEEETEVSFTYATLDRTNTISVSSKATVDELRQQILEEELALQDIPAAAAARPTRKNKKTVDIVRSNVREFGACGDRDGDCRWAVGAKMAYRFGEADLVNRTDFAGSDDRCGFCRQPLEAVCLRCPQGGDDGGAAGAMASGLTLVTVGSGEGPKKLPVADGCPIVKNTSCNHKFHWHCLCRHFEARMKTTGLRTCPSCQTYWHFSLPQPQTATAAVGATSFDLEVFLPSSTVCGVGGGQADWQRAVIRLNSNTTRKQLSEALARALGFDATQWGLRVLRVGQLTIPLGSIALHESLEFVGIKLRAISQIITYQRGGSAATLPCITATLSTARHHPLTVKLKLQLPVGYTVKQGTQTSRQMELVAASDHKLKTLSHRIHKASGLLSDRVRLSLREEGDSGEMRLRDPRLSVVDIIALVLGRSSTDDSNKTINLTVSEASAEDARFLVDILSAYHRMPSYSGKWTVQQLIDHLKYVPALSPDVTAYVNVRPAMALATSTSEEDSGPAEAPAAAAAAAAAAPAAMDTESDGKVIDVDSEDREDSDEDDGGQEGNECLDAVFAASSHWGLPMNVKNNVKRQTSKGVSDLLASLYVLAEKADPSSVNKLTGHLRAVVSFPPAVYAMRVILSAKTGCAKQIGPADKALVARVMFKLLREMAPSTIPDEHLFEHSRVLLNVLASRARSQDADTETYRKVPLTCTASHTRLTHPFYSESVQESNLTVRNRLLKLCNGLRDESMTSSSSASVPSPSKHMALLLQATPTGCMEVLVWLPPEDEAMDEGPMAAASRSLSYQWAMVKKDAANPKEVKCLQLVSPAALGQAQAPALTIDEDLRTAVYRGMEPCGSGRMMYRPVFGCESVFDLSALADKVSGYIEEMGEGELAEQQINEAIIVVLDCSTSMCERTTFGKDGYDEDFWKKREEEVKQGWDHTDPEDDSPQALEAALKKFRNYPAIREMRSCVVPLSQRRHITVEAAAKRVIQELCKLNRLDVALQTSRRSSIFYGGDRRDRLSDENTTRMMTKYTDRFVAALLEKVPRDGHPIVPDDPNEPPPEFICPITFDVMKNPVKASDGIVYDREAIQKWWDSGKRTSPLNGRMLQHSIFEPQNELKERITKWRGEEQPEAEPAAATSRRPRHHRGIGGDDDGWDRLTPALLMVNLTDSPYRDMWRNFHDVFPLVVPSTLTVEGLRFRLWAHASHLGLSEGYLPSRTCLWGNLENNGGDNYRIGKRLDDRHDHVCSVTHHGHPQSLDARRTNWGEFLNQQAAGSVWPCEPRPINEESLMRRLHVVAQLFSTLLNRIEAYDTPNCLGLILFSDRTKIRYTCQLSPYLERFRRAVDDATWDGETAIFDAVKRAREELVKWKAAKPTRAKAQLRIIVLSDGEDSQSETTWFSEAKALRESDVLCDAVMIGGRNNDQLKYLAKATGGYVFKPDSIRSALKLCELEVMLSASERPPNLRPDSLPNSEFMCSALLGNSIRFPIDVCNDTTVPPRRQVAQLQANQTFRSLAAALQANKQADEDGEGGQGQGEGSQWVGGRRQSARIASHGHAAQEGGGQGAARVSGGGGEGGGGNQERTRRLMREMRGLLQHPHPAVDVYPSQTDIGFWRIVMEGPDGTVYKDGTWLLYMIFPADYPNRPPELRFETPIQHANVNAYGKICHPILGRAYTTDSTVRSILENVYGLLLNPDYVDPVDSTLAMAFYQGQGDYEARIVQHVRQHARRTRQQWKNTLTAEGGEAPGAGAGAGAAAAAAAAAGGGGDPLAGRRTRQGR